jgi:hypothetical protein
MSKNKKDKVSVQPLTSHLSRICCSIENLDEEKLYEPVNVTYDHFVVDFLQLNNKFSCFQIAVELSFQNGECIFDKLTSPVSYFIKLVSHFLTINATNNLIIVRTDWDDQVRVKVFSDLTMNCFRIVSPIHHITLRLSYLVILSEQPVSVPGIVNPAFGSDEPSDNLLIGVNRDRSFQEMFSNLSVLAE